ncbi:biotin--[acetyl-CoA-carboxylase] ligase [Aceticella autotrophica]|uniref:Bifunctional ligase/repressor BirA n=1 Tax=Aceticella autotrophica TaxID=2755338 RepID=A0A975AX50_9THEO|nr:biotin--[acetyl-CoA-carboxylase] ligase [Aceticella autotrophica]QSZ28117.1 biotin--[acetyl-CoA-carboxylase] ligase [Aceticella autotrophica]
MIKENIIKILKENKNKFVSGQQLCNKLNISRTAVWKYINELKNNGYMIESQHKSGYMLINEPDIIDYIEISPFLKTDFIGKNYIHLESISSTNDYAKEIASKAENGTIVVSEEQTSGRGRLGRKWVSEKGQGLWMSIILKPELTPQSSVKLTQVAAVSVVNAIIETIELNASIKWPNDIIINGKKICGILTEMNAELDRVNYVIVGIGLNVNMNKFPDDLKDKATSLFIETGKKIDRKKLTASIINNFEKYYYIFLKEGFEPIRISCLKHSVTIGSEVRVISGKNEFNGKAVDIDNDGNLIIEIGDGSRKAVMSGDVSVRGILGYV